VFKETIYKLVIFFLIIIILAGAVVIIAMVTKDISLLPTGPSAEKIIEIENAHIIGRQEGNKIWEIWAKHAWSPSGERVTNFENITNGQVYQKKRLMIRSIRASKINVYRATDDLEMQGTPTLEAEVNLWESRPNNFASMEAQYLKYERVPQQTRIQQNIKIRDREEIITAENIEINNQDNTAVISGNLEYRKKNLSLRGEPLKADLNLENIKLENGFWALITPEKDEGKVEKTNLSGKYLEYFIKDDVVEMKEGIFILQGERWVKGEKALFTNEDKNLKIEGGVDSRLEEDTYLKCGRLTLSSEDKNAAAEDSVEVNQPGKLASGERAEFKDKTKTLTLSNNVKCVFEKGRDLIDQETARKLTHSEAKAALEEKTVLSADSLAISTENKNAKAKTKVLVSQKGKTAKADGADYDDQKKTITLSQNVYLLKETTGEWIKTGKVIVSVEDETFKAQGGVETEFILKK
jgi:lipopolysaccharide assembly outer membrane protein LptD (OstA)